MPLIKFDKPEVEAKIIELLQNTKIPCSIDFVAFNVGIGWGCASRALLNMALEKKIQSLKTTKGFVFWANAPRSEDIVEKRTSEPI